MVGLVSSGRAARSAGSGPSNGPALQRLTVENTDWKAVKSARVTSGGNQGGAAILDDGSTPVVVKAGETYGPESVIAAHLINSVGRKGLRGNNSVLADVSERCATALPAARGAQVVLARALTAQLVGSQGVVV